MNIKRNKKGLLVGSKSADLSFQVSISDVISLSIPSKASGEDFVIDGPGEYEVAGISVLAQISKENMDIVELIVDGVVILVIGKTFKYSARVHNALADVDVLVVDVNTGSDEKQELTELVNKFDVSAFIPLGKHEEIKPMLDAEGILLTDEVATFKFKKDSGDDSAPALQTYLLK